MSPKLTITTLPFLLYSTTALLLLLLLPTPTNSQPQNTENWWCGRTFTEASTSCNQSCPSGTGCPTGDVCFSGITTCTTTRYCGISQADANARCGTACPTGKGCPIGEACFLESTCGDDADGGVGGVLASLGLGSGGGGGGRSDNSVGSSLSSLLSSSNSALADLTGTALVEATFLQMRDPINDDLFLYETPMMEWIPSTVYRFDGFFDGLQIMHSQGVAGNKLYLGPSSEGEACAHCHMYGLVNVAAFLAQAMKETIRYDACDENSWDRVGVDEMYPLSNACGQLGQSYQDYHCSEEERHMECEVDPQMTITAVTNAKWWGAPGPLQCGPKSKYPKTGHWDFMYTCDNKWANPPETCDAYEGQTGGKRINDAAYPNAAGRTDVEGCCWWGRGVIQTSGVCNFGKLNYFLGKRAADEGRESRYPDIDFCRDPEAICSSKEHKELKWIAGFFYWISEVQRYDNGGWNYINELHKFVEGGMEGAGFINAVSGIVNRGCHNPPCGTGELDGGPERAQNFFDVIKEMRFSFVDVGVPQPVPSPTKDAIIVPPMVPQNPPLTSTIDLNNILTPQTPRPTPGIVGPPGVQSSPPEAEVRYTCGDGYQPGESDTSIPPSGDVVFDYEIHNGIDVSVGDALRDVKGSILSDIVGRIGCYLTYSGRKLQDSSDEFGSIISLQSDANDLPDLDAAGCMVGVESDDPTTCTPVSGGFTVYAKPGTSASSLQEVGKSLKNIIEAGMVAGLYETEVVDKAVYIGNRDYFSTASSAPISGQSDEADKSNERLHIFIYILASVCLILVCVLWFTVWTCRENEHRHKRTYDEEMTFNKFMSEKEVNNHSMPNMMMAPQVDDWVQPVQRRSPTNSRQNNSVPRNMKNSFDSNGAGEYSHSRQRSRTRVTANERQRRSLEAADEADIIMDESEEEILSVSSKSSDSSVEVDDASPIITQNDDSHRMKPSRKTSSKGGVVSSDTSGSSSSASSEDSNEAETFNNNARNARSSSPFAREERQKRMAAARARAAKRRQMS